MTRLVLLNEAVGLGAPPDGWERLAQRPLLVLVGVTGVGKSTAVAAMRAAGLAFTPLPDRRTLTDRVLIPAAQRAAGLPQVPVTDRTQRFDLTRRYRERYPGGMAHALSRLCVRRATSPEPGWLLFDGLRGVNEVTAAAERLPRARFLCLHAPDFVRVLRLLGRADVFDAAATSPAGATGAHGLDPALTAGLLTDAQAAALMAQVHTGQLTLEALWAKLAIVRAERLNYDPAATSAALQRLAPGRTLFCDTVALPPEEIARQVQAMLQAAAVTV